MVVTDTWSLTKISARHVSNSHWLSFSTLVAFIKQTPNMLRLTLPTHALAMPEKRHLVAKDHQPFTDYG